ncbi:MAG: hypothetical protein SFT93_02515 [Rickettsiaceae bacterium]|nr:hypothetical protein [Rickettsiaceae bacterium]
MLKAIEQSAGHWAHGYIPTQQIQAFLSNEAWNLEGPYFKGIAGFIYILHLVHNPDFVDLVDGAEKGVYSLVGGTSNIDDQAELKTSEA